jgi:hypothetical protein
VDLDALTRATLRLEEPRIPVPPPAPPAAGPMRNDEAERAGLEYCSTRGYTCRVDETHLERDGRVWRVKLLANPPMRGHVHLELDARTRSVLEAREDVKRM